MLSTQFKNRMRELAGTIAPEISQPLYLLDHPSHLPLPAGCGGYAPYGTCSQLKQSLIEAGEWYGPGPQIVFCDGDDIGVFIHELAHVVPFKRRQDTANIPAARELRKSYLRQWAAEPIQPTTRPKWEPDHSIDFIRVCLNLVWRAVAAGAQVNLGDIAVAGSEYGLSDPCYYAAAIGDEPKRMLGKTFTEILATPAPDAFLDLFTKDTQ